MHTETTNLRLMGGIIAFLWYAPLMQATFRYYFGYLSYGTGDTIISAFHNHGGPNIAHRKWIVECLDGEAMIGIQDFNDDFERMQAVWCKFMFPHKPPSQGLYPYYPSCLVRNMTDTFFCFDARNASSSLNTFITGLWDNEFNWFQFRPGGYNTINGDDLQPYKCCKTPKGYYIDYISCYYVPTHDVYYEFYDSTQHIMVYCANGYVMTGIAKKKTPFEQEYHVEYIQCCRLGFGTPTAVSPPAIYNRHGMPSYHSQARMDARVIPEGYLHQYKSYKGNSSFNALNGTSEFFPYHDHGSARYTDGPIPLSLAHQKSAPRDGGNSHAAHEISIRSIF